MSTTNVNGFTSQAGHADPAADWDGEDSLAPEILTEFPAWGISLVVHVAILAVIGLITIPPIVREQQAILTTKVEERVESEEFKFDTAVVDEIGSDSDANLMGPSLAAASRLGAQTHREMERKLESQLLDVKEPMIETLPTPSESNLVESFTATGSTEYPGGTAGSIDRITQEIASSLRERKTLVVWLFDESGSVDKRRNEIADRFENIYKQLGLLEDLDNKALKTAVASFGQQTHIMTPEPIDDVANIIKAVREIPLDETGVENVFGAVNTIFKKWKDYRRKMHRNMMIIVVTDERGDDYHLLEPLIAQIGRYGIKVHCIGNAAGFGREKGYVSHTWTVGKDTFTEDLPVDQGPETVSAERVQLPFWSGNRRNLDRMSSAHGPYALTRLCVETGGIFFIAGDTGKRNFDPGVMRNYQPDYRPIADYQRQLSTNMAKAALIRTAQTTAVQKIPIPQFVFQANNDNILRQQITEAQKPLAELEYHLNNMHVMLDQGEKDRAKLDTPRWRAGYDLAMGRVLAMRVRAFGYNVMLADMKSSPQEFKGEKNNQWRLVPSDDVESGPIVRKLHKKAVEYLTRVIDQHEGTPWAVLAEVELSQKLGWAWKEGYLQVAKNNNRGGNNNPGVRLAPDEVRKRTEQQRRQKARQMSRPKL